MELHGTNMELTHGGVGDQNWVFLGGVCYVVSKVEFGCVGEGGGTGSV